MRILQAKLALLEEEKRNSVSSEIRGEYHEAKWGNQIRSYVLQPYRLVKDHRNDYETSDVERVLDGDIDDFIEEYRKSVV
jgi:peptide chain release factor 2